MRDEIFDLELEFTQPVFTIIVEKKKWASMTITPVYQNVAVEGIVL